MSEREQARVTMLQAATEAVAHMDKAAMVALGKAQLDYIRVLTQELADQSAALAAALRSRDEERSDARMFAWWFSNTRRTIDIGLYLEGVREGWTLAQWRGFVQAQMDRALSARSGEGE